MCKEVFVLRKIYILLSIIFILIFLIFYYKNLKLGNTIIKIDKEEVIENILKRHFKYEAKVKVYSNKNENEYRLKIVEDEKNSLLEAIGENSISGLKIEKKNGDLTVKNTKLKLDKIYENYQEMTDNSLFLSTFRKDCKETNKITEEETTNSIVIKIILKNETKYIKYKELYISKTTGMPTKMIIKDSSKQPKIIIEYTSIETL